MHLGGICSTHHIYRTIDRSLIVNIFRLIRRVQLYRSTFKDSGVVPGACTYQMNPWDF